MVTFYRPEQTFLTGSKTLAREYYASPEIYATEIERIFTRRWFCAGHASRIPNTGDYFLLDAHGESVIIVRDQAGQVQAFYNVCRHRGTRVCEAPEGQLNKSIQCPYHAWTYGLDGKLIGAPLMKDVEDFDRDNYPLHTVAMHIWQGFIFLNFSAAPEPFEQAFAPLVRKFKNWPGWELARLKPARRVRYEVRANWKLIFQNYNECYHCAPLHPQLVKISPPTSGENDFNEGPVLGGFMLITDADSLTLSGRACAIPVGEIPAEDHRRVYYYSIAPNMLLSLHPDYVMFHTIWPRSSGESTIDCEWLFHPEAFGREDFNPEDGIEFWDQTNRQDWHICEQAQLGVSSRAYRPSPYSPRESLPAAFDRDYLAQMESN
jgi:glycine betaine catabolism A